MYTEGKSYKTRNDARTYVVEFIESFYNRKKPHSSIGYQIPAVVMQAFFDRTRDAFAEEEKPIEATALGSSAEVIQAA